MKSALLEIRGKPVYQDRWSGSLAGRQVHKVLFGEVSVWTIAYALEYPALVHGLSQSIR